MSAPSSKPPVPRPTVRSTIPPASPAALVRTAYKSEPPVIRDRTPTLELEDADLVEDISAPPDSQVRPRLASYVEDPSEALFDGMYEMNFAESQASAAQLCAQALGRALGARTVIVHAHDLRTRELRAIGVFGEGEFDVLGSGSASDDDLVASAVICNEKPLTMRFDGELPRLAPRRLGMIETPRTLVAIPAMAWGRCVAVIEIIDADERLASRVADSGLYVASRFAEFLSHRAAA